jgi:predicted nucleic acid-binding protein
MSAVLADAGPLFALSFRSDQYHTQALADRDRLTADRLRVIVAYPTAIESYTLVLRSGTPEHTFRWFNALRENTEFINPTDDDYLVAVQLIQRYDDQPITLADGVLAVVSRRLGMPVWTYDHHVDVLRVSRWRYGPNEIASRHHQMKRPLPTSRRGYPPRPASG